MDFWISKYDMQKIVTKCPVLHSQTRQGIIDTFYESLSSWRSLRKTNPMARAPHKLAYYHAIPFKESAIKVRDGFLVLSTGKDNQPVTIPWGYDTPKFCEISWSGNEYVLNATYVVTSPEAKQLGVVAGVDLGEIHLAVANIGTETFIANGRELRSKRRYQNKVKGKFQSLMSRCKKGSRKHRKLKAKKQKVQRKLNNQIKDILHKQTTKFVNTLDEKGVSMVAIGDIRNIRLDAKSKPKKKKNKNASQHIHQMPSGQVRLMITYKSEIRGISVVLVNEAYSSQTCPHCGKRHKPNDRNYICPYCGFEYHRDGVGAINIRQKQMYLGYVPVVGDMAPPVGMRYAA